jgi:hypothetical protein
MGLPVFVSAAARRLLHLPERGKGRSTNPSRRKGTLATRRGEAS